MNIQGPSHTRLAFISQDDIDKEFTIKVLDKGNFGKIRIALSKEKEKDKQQSTKHIQKTKDKVT
jgi:hypothetical protein